MYESKNPYKWRDAFIFFTAIEKEDYNEWIMLYYDTFHTYPGIQNEKWNAVRMEAFQSQFVHYEYSKSSISALYYEKG